MNTYIERTPTTEPEPSASQSGVRGPYPSPRPLTPNPQCVEFLLQCLSTSRQPSAVGREPLAVSRQPSADWSEVVAVAADHGLTPLLYSRLKESSSQACVPADVWERLRRAHFASAVRNMSLYGELRKVLQRLRSSGIPVIVLKGAFLAEAVYDDVALRPMVDVDLMVPRAELSRAHAVLVDIGRVRQQSEGIESRLRRSRELRLSAGAGIDIHWAIVTPASRFRLDLTGFWDRARPATIAGVEVLALSPEDLLLHLCLHTSYGHVFGEGVRPLCDIAATIRRFGGDMDWMQVAERAREWRAARYVGLTLHLARSMLGAEVPDDVLEQLVPGDIDQRVLETARESVLARSGYGPWVPLFHLRSAKSLADKARMFWGRIFLSRDEMAAKYPTSRGAENLGFYYVLRLRDGLRAFGAYALSRGRSRRSRRRGRRVPLTSHLESGKPTRQAELKAKADVKAEASRAD